jgi:nucleolar protein 58
MELIRGIRTQFESLVSGISEKEFKAMTLGLSHSLSRHTLKFSADKVDLMIVQAISLLDDIDKELNNYSMRLKEWYSWHFPELAKIVGDNLVYAKLVKEIGMRKRIKKRNLSEIIPEDVEEQVREAAEISMGTEISTEDIQSIRFLCD